MKSIETRYDDEYPPLDSHEVKSWTGEPLSNAEMTNNMEFYERKTLNIPERSLPENVNEFYQMVAQDIKKYGGSIVMSKMPSGSYNLNVKCPSQHMGNVIGIIRVLVENKITKEIPLDSYIIDKLTLENGIIMDSVKEFFDGRVKIVIENNSIHVSGVSSDVEKAVELLMEKIEKLRCFEERILVDIDPKYFPLVRGAFDINLKNILSTVSKPVSIIFPPIDSGVSDIRVSGFTNDVEIVCAYLLDKYQEFSEYQETTLPMAPKYRDNIIRVSGIDKILKETGVAVYISPNKDDKKIYLIGHEDNLAEAVPVILNRAKNYDVCEISCSSWLYNILKSIPEFDVVNLKKDHKELWFSYVSNKELIMLDGPSALIKKLELKFTSKIAEIKNSYSFKHIQYPATFMNYLKNRGLQELNDSLLECNAHVDLGNVLNQNKVIPINCSLQMQLSGNKSQIDEAYKIVTEYMTSMKQNFSLEIEFEAGFLPHIQEICLNNSIVEQIRCKYGSLIKVTLRTPKIKRRNYLTLFGMKGTVLSAEMYFEEFVNRVGEQYTVKDLSIPKAYHHLIIGRGGLTRNRIIEESGIEQLFVPVADYKGPDATVISICGKKEYVETAEALIMEVCNIDVELDEVEFSISKALADQLKLLDNLVLRKFIQNATKNHKEVGGAMDVSVVFASDDETGSVLKMRGPKKLLKILTTSLTSLSTSGLYTELISVEEIYFKSIIGRNGANMQKLTGNSTASLIIPSIKQNKLRNNDKIAIMAYSKGDLNKLKDNLYKFLQELKDVKEVKVKVPVKFAKKFTMRQGDEECLLQQYQNSYPSVKISSPKEEGNEDYTIRGSSAFVDKVQKEMINQINFWEKMVTGTITIASEHLACARQYDKNIINTLCDTHKVMIRLRKEKNATTEDLDEVTNRFVVTIEGLPNKVELVKKFFEDYKPVHEEMKVPKKYHSSIIGSKGAGLKKLLEGIHVSLKFPPNDDISEMISLTGPASHLEIFKTRLKPIMSDMIKRQTDWEQKNQMVELDIDPKWYSKLIGKGGSFVNSLKTKYDVSIFIPGVGNNSNVILLDHKFVTIKGEINKIKLAKKKLEELVTEWENTDEEVIQVPKEYHARIRGVKSANIRNIQRKTHVEVRFAPQTELNNNSIFLRGRRENIQAAIKEINQLVDSYTQAEPEEDYSPVAERSTIDKFKFTKREPKNNQTVNQGKLSNYNQGLRTLQEIYERDAGNINANLNPSTTETAGSQEPGNDLNH